MVSVVVRWAPLVHAAHFADSGAMVSLDLMAGPCFHPEGALVLTETAPPMLVSVNFILQSLEEAPTAAPLQANLLGTPFKAAAATPVRAIAGTPVRAIVGTPVRAAAGTPVRAVAGTPVRAIAGTPVRAAAIHVRAAASTDKAAAAPANTFHPVGHSSSMRTPSFPRYSNTAQLAEPLAQDAPLHAAMDTATRVYEHVTASNARYMIYYT